MIVFCHHGRIITTRFTFEEDLGHGNGIKTFSFTHLKNKMLVLTSSPAKVYNRPADPVEVTRLWN